MNFLEKLEDFKSRGFYDLCLYYGEGVGADDGDVPMMKRKLVVILIPVGCLGEVKCLYYGTVERFLAFDFSNIPTILNNPPENKEYEKYEWTMWGTSSGVDAIVKHWEKRQGAK